MHRRDRDPSLVALERRIDRLQRVLAAEEMLGDGDRDIADRDAVLAGKLDFFWRSGRAQKLCNASSRLLLLEADEVAAAEVIDEARQPDRFDDEQQHVAFPALHHPPQRRTSLPSGKRGFVFVQVVRGNDAEHVIGLVVPLLHPADDILARSDLPIVNMRLMMERRQFLRDPMRPLLVALREADKDVRHAPPPAARDGASSYREIRGARAALGSNSAIGLSQFGPLEGGAHTLYALVGLSDDVEGGPLMLAVFMRPLVTRPVQ